jgi:membrane protease YdiL (CAAX protease family)
LHRPLIATGRRRDWVGEYPLLAYFALAFGFSWIVELLAFGLLDVPELPGIIVAAFGPATAAVLVTRTAEGRSGVRALLRRLLLWRVDRRWYAFALVGIPVLGVLSFVFLPDGTENLPDSALLIAPTYLLLVVIMATLGGGQEELGWRGFALPRLQPRFGPLAGTVLLGVLWGLWHLPLYVLVDDYNNAGSGFVRVATSFLGFVGYTIAISLIMTWVFNHTRGSLLLAMLVHGALNATFGLAPETTLAAWSLTLAIAALALVIAAATHGHLGYRRMPLEAATAATDD